jgi:hypothetical protein
MRIDKPECGLTAALDLRKLMEDYGVECPLSPGDREAMEGAARDVRLVFEGYLAAADRSAYPLPRWVVYVHASDHAEETPDPAPAGQA